MTAVAARRAGILRLVVREYVETAAPVGSRAIREKYGLTASPATIRNDMQALEAEGLLTHPYTSAGRVPSDRGYRVYVEALMGREDLREEEKATIRHQFFQAAPEMDSWAELAAVVLARSLGLLAVVEPPRSHDVRVRRVELVQLKEMLALLVVVLQEARVLNQLVTLEDDLSQDELNALSARINEQVAGRSLSQLRAGRPADLTSAEPAIPEGTSPDTRVTAALVHLLEEASARESDARVEGMAGVLEQPEFQDDHERFARVMSLLDRRAFERLVPAPELADRGVRVVIGEENRAEELQDCTVVISPYGLGSEITGFVGLVGPTRLEYGRSIASVRYLSMLLQEMMERVYG